MEKDKYLEPLHEILNKECIVLADKHQIVYCTEDALKCISFEGSDKIEK